PLRRPDTAERLAERVLARPDPGSEPRYAAPSGPVAPPAGLAPAPVAPPALATPPGTVIPAVPAVPAGRARRRRQLGTSVLAFLSRRLPAGHPGRSQPDRQVSQGVLAGGGGHAPHCAGAGRARRAHAVSAPAPLRRCPGQIFRKRSGSWRKTGLL